jgi:hypothetical protein
VGKKQARSSAAIVSHEAPARRAVWASWTIAPRVEVAAGSGRVHLRAPAQRVILRVATVARMVRLVDERQVPLGEIHPFDVGPAYIGPRRDNGVLAGMSQPAWEAELARLNQGILVLCGEVLGGDAPQSASPVLAAEAATPAPAIVPTPRPSEDQDQPANPAACLLLSQLEVDAVISAAPNADDPYGFPSAAIAGCDYVPNYPPDYAGLQSSLTVVYFLSGGQDVYDGLASGPGVSGVADQASLYPGAEGSGIVFVKGDRTVALEFHNINPGDAAMLTLAREAAARVH